MNQYWGWNLRNRWPKEMSKRNWRWNWKVGGGWYMFGSWSYGGRWEQWGCLTFTSPPKRKFATYKPPIWKGTSSFKPHFFSFHVDFPGCIALNKDYSTGRWSLCWLYVFFWWKMVFVFFSIVSGASRYCYKLGGRGWTKMITWTSTCELELELRILQPPTMLCGLCTPWKFNIVPEI